MKTIQYLFIIFFIKIQSCVETNSTEFQFEESKYVKCIPTKVVDSVFFRYPFRVRQKDTTLYVLELHGREFYCTQLSYPNLEFRKMFAPKGNGPEDFLSVENIRLSNAGDVYLLDANKETISIFNPKEDSIGKRIILSKELLRSLDFALINDSLFVIADYTGNHRINIVDFNGKIQQQLFQIPTKNKDYSVFDVMLAQAWRSFMDYNPNNGILTMATQLGQVVNVTVGILLIKKPAITSLYIFRNDYCDFNNLR